MLPIDSRRESGRLRFNGEWWLMLICVDGKFSYAYTKNLKTVLHFLASIKRKLRFVYEVYEKKEAEIDEEKIKISHQVTFHNLRKRICKN